MDEIDTLRKENFELRAQLALCYCGYGLYTDDGELQDAREFPFIDFKRMSVEQLRECMYQRSLNQFKAMSVEEQAKILGIIQND